MNNNADIKLYLYYIYIINSQYDLTWLYSIKNTLVPLETFKK